MMFPNSVGVKLRHVYILTFILLMGIKWTQCSNEIRLLRMTRNDPSDESVYQINNENGSEEPGNLSGTRKNRMRNLMMSIYGFPRSGRNVGYDYSNGNERGNYIKPETVRKLWRSAMGLPKKRQQQYYVLY